MEKFTLCLKILFSILILVCLKIRLHLLSKERLIFDIDAKIQIPTFSNKQYFSSLNPKRNPSLKANADIFNLYMTICLLKAKLAFSAGSKTLSYKMYC